MIYRRCKLLYRAFALAARDAAGRFVWSLASARSSRHSWRPLVLRWRQRHNRQKNVLAGRSASNASVHWFPQFHFHFATHLNERSRGDRLPGSFPAAGNREGRVVLDQHWTILRAAPLPLQPSRSHRPLRAMYGRESSPPASNIGPTAMPSVSRPPAAHSIEPRAAHRPRQLHFERMPGADRTSMQKEELPQSFQTHLRIWQHWLQVFRLSRPQQGRGAQRSRESKALPVQFVRPEELAWRRALRPPADFADNERHPELAESNQRLAVRSHQGQEVAVGVSPSVTRTGAPQVIRLDPTVLDRLTDDVIRRVEQRARIERQRRGL